MNGNVAKSIYDNDGKPTIVVPWLGYKDIHTYKSEKTRSTSEKSRSNGIIIGNNTFKSVGNNPLSENRHTCVLSHNNLYSLLPNEGNLGEKLSVKPNLDTAIDFYNKKPDIENIIVCGGADVLSGVINSEYFIDECNMVLIKENNDCDIGIYNFEEFHDLLESSTFIREVVKDEEEYVVINYINRQSSRVRLFE